MVSLGLRTGSRLSLLFCSAILAVAQDPAISQGSSAAKPLPAAREFVARMVANETHMATNDHSQWRYLSAIRKDGHIQLWEKVQTTGQVAGRLLNIDGRPLTETEKEKEARRLEKLETDADYQKKIHDEQLSDAKHAVKMFEMLPNAFLYEYDPATTGQRAVRLTFRPDPAFHPASHEAQVFHALIGEMVIDAREMRLLKISGTLSDDVKFGMGLLGHLDKGGSFTVEQTEVSPGV